MASRTPLPARRPRGRAVNGYSPGRSIGELSLTIWLAAFGIVGVSLAPLGLIALLQPGSGWSSLLLATALYIPCVIFAAMTLYFGRGAPVQSRLVAAGFALGGLAVAVLSGGADYNARVTTLYEAEVAGSPAARPGEAPPVRELSFSVEHPGVAHSLAFWPKMEGLSDPDFDALVRVELLDSAGATLLQHEELFWVRHERNGTDWGSASLSFTPTEAGRHTLRVTPVTPGIPLLHVRVSDPEKRDGERMPGY